tara:strand:+ start:16831 stop:19122 length:2292 start_codon:yes stop_codon:yes gene_type:complete
MGAGFAFFVNRYTTPTYYASSVVKISEKNDVNQMMNFENIYETNLVAEMSRLKSKKMLSEALADLKLDVNYYSKGKFLNTENYRSSKYKISYQIKDKSVLNKLIQIEFVKGCALLSFNDDPSSNTIVPVNTWTDFEGLALKINISNINQNKLSDQNLKFLFMINNEKQIVNHFSKGLDVSIFNVRAKTIKIGYSGDHPEKCADIVNSLASAFLISNISKKKESANQMIKFTDDQVVKINKRLEYYRKLLKPYKELGSSETKDDFDYNQLTRDLKGKDENEKIELQASLSDFTQFQLKLSENPSNEELYSILLLNSTNKYLSSVGTSLKQLLAKRRELSFRVTEESYEVKEIDFQIKLQLNDLKEVVSNLIVELRENIQLIDERLTSYVVAKASKVKDFDHNSDYLHLERMYEINSDYYSKLLTKKAEYEMVKAGFVSDNEIIEPAKANIVPIAPDKMTNFIIGCSIGLIIGLIIIVIKYLLHNTVSSTGDVMRHTNNIPILGMVPSFRDAVPVSQLIVDKNPKSLMSEAFRSIRSNLQFISNSEDSKILTVTSTISGEGKTFIAINLGGIIAFSEKKVIILDLDMRKPKTHIGFNVQNTVGMSTLLIGKTTLDECIQKSNLENLHFITAGPIPPNPSELIISKKMTNIFNQLREVYDVIVIDTPPVGIVTDALPIISKVDYPIYIVRAHFSKKMFLKNIQILKDKKGIRNLSIILNGADGGKRYSGYSKYGYGYGYGYGGSNGYYEEKQEKEKPSWKKLFVKS